jgi:acetyl esterase
MLDLLKIKFLRVFGYFFVLFVWRGYRPPKMAIGERRIPVENGRIKVRIYTPDGSGPFPVILFFHGGGWVAGSPATHDPLCRELCSRAGHVVVSVDYRLAPEHRFPCAPDDCLAALKWLVQHGADFNIDLDRLAVCGDSAGGNLAAVIALLGKEELPGLIKAQVLIYPVTDHYSAMTDSFRECAEGALSARDMRWLWDTYLGTPKGNAGRRYFHELATPLAVADLKGLPDALVITAEHDVLRDEGIAYAEKLSLQGARVQQTTYSGVQHGFLSGDGLTPNCDRALSEIADWLCQRTDGAAGRHK